MKNLLRIFKVEKQSSIIQITGLILAILTCIFIFSNALFEFSFDRFNTNKDLIYRTQTTEAMPLGALAKDNLSYVKSFARLHPCYRGISVQIDENVFNEETVYYADGSLFDIFSFPVVAGNVSKALSVKDHLAISECYAKKYFGDQNPIGKTITINGAYERDKNYIVGAVFKDIPVNCHVQFNMLLSIENILAHKMYSEDNTWKWNNFFTYFQTKHQAQKEMFAKDLSLLANSNGAQLENERIRSISLFDLDEIHLNGQINFMDNNARKKDIGILVLIALLVMIISWVNYINISIGSAINYKQKLAVKKVLGARPFSLWLEIFDKMLVLNIIAIFFSIILFFMFKPVMNRLFEGYFQYTFNNQIKLWAIIMTIQFLGILAVSYAIHVLQNRQNLISLLSKRSKTLKGQQSWIFLFVLQFSISIVLICFAFFSTKQVNGLMNVARGIDTKQVLALRSANVSYDGDIFKSRSVFEDEVLKLPQVLKSTSSTYIPGNQISSNMPTRLSNKTQDENVDCYMNWIGYDYIPLFQHKFIAGRNFSKEFSSDNTGVIINETLAKDYGFINPEDAIGKEIFWETRNTYKTIIGVIEDFYHQSADIPIEPTMFHLWDQARGYCLLSIESSNTKATINDIETIWNRIHKGNAFEYLWIDENYNKQFHKWERYSNIINIFSLIAIVIASIGLFGLSAMLIAKRTKEIGVRKVNGANDRELVLLLNKQFMRLVIVAFLVACPIAWLTINNWLNNFAYKTHISWWIFILSGFIAFIIAFLTVSLKTIKASRTNPVVALRYE